MVPERVHRVPVNNFCSFFAAINRNTYDLDLQLGTGIELAWTDVLTADYSQLKNESCCLNDFFTQWIQLPVERVKGIPCGSRLQGISTIPRLLEHGCVDGHRNVRSLVVEGDHLESELPELNWIEVRRIDSHAPRICPHDMILRIVRAFEGMLSAQLPCRSFRNRCDLKKLTLKWKCKFFDSS